MLIVSQAGQATRLERQSFANEAALQAYLSSYPQAIPLSESDDQPKLHVLGREFPTASGPIDILGTDEDGEAYIIETKLYKNPDKRLVIAQVIDYGAALWAEEPDTGSVLTSLRQIATRRGAPEPLSSLATFLNGDEEAASVHLDTVRNSLADGRFTAIVLMDRLGDRLRDLIRFMNENSRFRLLAAELDYYRHGDAEFVYPRLFGSETRRPVNGAVRSRSSHIAPEDYLTKYASDQGPEAVAHWRTFEQAILNSGVPGIGLGHRPKGTPYLFLANTLIGEVRLFILADKSEVRDYLHFRSDAFEAQQTATAAREELRTRLIAVVPGAKLAGDVGRVYLPLNTLAGHRDDTITAVRQFAATIGAG